MCAWARNLHFGGDTTALAVWIFDQMLSTVRVACRYTALVAATSMHIASKICEEATDDNDTVHACATLLRRLDAPFSVREMLRMERCVLERIAWDTSAPTVHRFLQMVRCMRKI